MSNRNKLISLAPRKLKSAPKPMPSLKEFWEELQRAKNGYTAAPTSARGDAGYGVSSGRLYGSGSGSGSGSGGAGYGIGLIVSDEESQQRIRMIMKELCEHGK